MEVQSPPGEVVGYVRQDCSFWNPRFTLMNTEEQPSSHISVVDMVDLCCRNVPLISTFDVATLDGTSVGNCDQTVEWSR